MLCLSFLMLAVCVLNPVTFRLCVCVFAIILHALTCVSEDYVRCPVAGRETTLAPDVSVQRPKS